MTNAMSVHDTSYSSIIPNRRIIANSLSLYRVLILSGNVLAVKPFGQTVAVGVQIRLVVEGGNR